MDEKQFKIINEKIDKMTKLMAITALTNKEREQDKVELLDALGFRTSEIALILNKSSQNVSTVLGNIRKKKIESGEPPANKEPEQPTEGKEQTTLPTGLK